MSERGDLPLTVPVEDIIAQALQRLNEIEGLDRDEVYLLARLGRAHETERTAALVRAIADAPDEAVAYTAEEVGEAIHCAERAMAANQVVTPWAVLSHLDCRCGCEKGGGGPTTASREPPMGGLSEYVRIPEGGRTNASDA